MRSKMVIFDRLSEREAHEGMGNKRMKKNRVGIIGMVAMVAMVAAVIFTGCIEKESLGTIYVDINSSTWKGWGEPFDIYSAIKEKLEKAGFEVVANDNNTHNATLLVDYKEEMGSKYCTGTSCGFATNIACNLKLYDKDHHLLFVKEIKADWSDRDYLSYTGVISYYLYDRALEAFEEKSWFVCLGEIVSGKYSIGDEVPALIIVLKEDKDEDIRKSAAYVLGEIGDKRAVEPLIYTLKDKSKWDRGSVSAARVRASAAAALGKIGDKRAVEPLIDAVNNDEGVSRSAARALGNLDVDDKRVVELVELLIKALSDKDSNIRESAAAALGEIGDKRAVEPLIDALNDENLNMRRSTATALGEIGDKRAVEPLIDALKDEKEWWARISEVNALGKIGDERAVMPLTAVLEDGEGRDIRYAAQAALENIEKAKIS